MSWWRFWDRGAEAIAAAVADADAHVVAAAAETDPAQPARPAPARHHPSLTDWPHDVGASHVSRGLKPERLAAILREAEDGQPQRQAQLCFEIFDKDGRLAGLANTRKLAVASLPWSVQAASTRRRDKMIAGYVSEVIGGISNRQAGFVGLLEAIFAGYGAAEIDWRQDGADVWVEKLLPRPAHWFVPDSRRADLWRLLTKAEPATGEALAPGAWCWHEAWAKSGGTAAASALMRPVTRAFLVRNYGIRDWLIFAEIYGQPMRVGRFRDGTSEADMAIAFRMLKNMGRDAAALLPTGVELQLLEAQRGTSVEVYKALVDWAAGDAAVAILGQTLTSDAGDKGSRALGAVHDNVRRDLVGYDAEQLADTLNRDLVRYIVDFRFGPQADYPKLGFSTTTPEERATSAKLYTELAGLGVRFPVAHVHQTFGIPQAEDGEPVYEGRAQPVAPRAGQTAGSHVHDDLGCPRCGAAPRTIAGAAGGDEGGRMVLPDELERAVQLALEGGQDDWREVVAQLRAWIAGCDTLAQVDERLLDTLHALKLEPFAQQLLDATLTAELVGRVQVAQGEQPVGDWPELPPEKASAWWRKQADMDEAAFERLAAGARHRGALAARFTTLGAVKAIHAAFQESLDRGETLADFEDRYNAALSANGYEEDQPHRVANVFRTSMARAYGVGRYEEQAEPDMLSDRPYWLYDGTDDTRTRPTHRAFFGKCWPASHAIWGVIYPPNGFQCRCYVRSLTAADVKARGLSIEADFPRLRRKLPDGTLGPEEIVLPDVGFQRNPAIEDETELDWSQFPKTWRVALGKDTP